MSKRTFYILYRYVNKRIILYRMYINIYKKKYENTFIKCSLSFNTKQNHPLFAKNQKVIFF